MRDVGDGGALLEQVLAETIPMYGRMIHSGKVGEPGESQNYDVHGRVSAGRWDGTGRDTALMGAV